MSEPVSTRLAGCQGKVIAFLLIAIAALPTAGCSGGEDPERGPNLLLISIDTARADHFGSYGYARDTSPNVGILAAEGARFEHAYAPMATTGPSHATLFTALYPLGHNVFKNGLVLDEEHTTLAQILERRGYLNAGFVSSDVLAPRYGLNRGFAVYDAPGGSTGQEMAESNEPTDSADSPGPASETLERDASETTERALRWLETAAGSEKPFFLFLHYFDPHAPYRPPKPFRTRYRDGPFPGRRTRNEVVVDRYDGELAFVDQQLGRVLRALDEHALSQDTLVVLTADHGESLGEHGWTGHGLYLYEDAVRVPLVMRWPDRIPSGLVLEEPVGLVDLVPSLLDLMGVDRSGIPFHGQSLANALLGLSTLDPERAIYLQRRRYRSKQVGPHPVAGDKFAIRVGRFKYIEALEEETKELYDLDSDPAELEDVAEHHPERVSALAAQLREWKTTHQAGTSTSATVSAEDRKRLEALGYVD